MDQDTRNKLQRATQQVRRILEEEFAEQLEGTFDVLPDGTIAAEAGAHLDPSQRLIRQKLVQAIAHIESGGKSTRDAIQEYLRQAAFTILNRFVALRMLEARDLLQECVSKGDDSSGFKEFCGLAPGLSALPDDGYRLYLECLCDELTVEIKVLFDRRDPTTLLWPRRSALTAMLDVLSQPELASVWTEDETIGWVYQYFNGDEERTQMRAESQAPRNSRELAVRNQFFTPRYVVQFLTDNTLGRTWYEMMQGDTQLDQLDYLVRRPNEVFLAAGESAPESNADESELSQEELLQQTVHVPFRAKKDPRDLRILDPACGSGHFLLYTFDLLLTIYEEAWSDAGAATFTETGTQLRADYASLEDVRRAMPEHILRHNLHGVDIDPRAAQIAALALWMRGQRAYNQFEVDRAQRPPITKTNIVVAEPMPGDAELVEEFAASLKPAVLGDVFKKMVEEMKLAGELGSLLKIEESIAKAVKEAEESHRKEGLFAEKIESQDFWDTADDKIIAALGRFAESAAGAGSVRRRLFAEDASQGVAFIELMRKRFDVALMNPPFGLVPEVAQTIISQTYAGAHNDVFAAFVRRGRSLSEFVGAITSRSFLVASRLEGFRRDDFLAHSFLLADLGLGVMDDALVESAAYCITQTAHSATIPFIDGRDLPDKAAALRSPQAILRSREFLLALPKAKALYTLDEGVGRVFDDPNHFDPNGGTAREGMKSFDNFRFLRLWWESPVEEIGRGRTWNWIAKGGSFAFFYSDLHLLLRWSGDGAELKAVNMAINGSTSQVKQASDYWYRSGATYSRRSAKGFSARALPADVIFTDKGPAILGDEVSERYLLGWLNSYPIRALIHLQANASDFLTGILKQLPWRVPSDSQQKAVEQAVESALRSLLFEASERETSPYFVRYDLGGFNGCADNRSTVTSTIDACTDVVRELYNFDDIRWAMEILEGEESSSTGSDLDNDPASERDAWPNRCSYALGVAIGRWNPKIEMWQKPPAIFGPQTLPQGLALGEEEQVLLVDDPGSKDDVAKAVEAVLLGASAESNKVREPSSARLRTRLSDDFFSEHIKQYSKSRRKAPIYWQLATASASYSVWLYYHRFTKDTFFQVLNDYVEPKLKYERLKLERVRSEAGAEPTRSQRKGIEDQEKFVAELATMVEEVERIAPLWNPNLNDGVIINFAPLWRLVPQNKSWQKECKSCWDKLVKGEYDWAHLAMHLWPERVVPKCVTDASFAIAHGLEEVFWEQDDRDRFQPKDEPAGGWAPVIKTLVDERTSPAVKAALESLITAPAPAGNSKSRRRKATT